MVVPEFGVSPFRTPEALARTRHLRTKAILRSARGVQLGRVDAKVWLFAVAHGISALLLYGAQTELTFHVHAALRIESTAAVAYTGTLAALCIATGVLYSRVYASDPGWVTDDVAPHESGSQKKAPPCQYCGVRPPLRSRHCLNTGQCVRKFDHYCHLLSTAVGDLNHADFFLFILCELTLSCWGVFTVGRWAGRCLSSAELPAAWQACWNSPQPVLLLPLGVALSLVATAFAYLVALHLYLMLTGQTTYEVVKGPRVPYLAPFFPVNEHCADYYALPAAFPRLLADTCLRRRTAPPAPFSRPSVVANLRLFWFARKPHVYRYTKTVDVDEGGDAEQPRLGPTEMAFAQAVDLQLSQRDV